MTLISKHHSFMWRTHILHSILMEAPVGKRIISCMKHGQFEVTEVTIIHAFVTMHGNHNIPSFKIVMCKMQEYLSFKYSYFAFLCNYFILIKSMFFFSKLKLRNNMETIMCHSSLITERS